LASYFWPWRYLVPFCLGISVGGGRRRRVRPWLRAPAATHGSGYPMSCQDASPYHLLATCERSGATDDCVCAIIAAPNMLMCAESPSRRYVSLVVFTVPRPKVDLRICLLCALNGCCMINVELLAVYIASWLALGLRVFFPCQHRR